MPWRGPEWEGDFPSLGHEMARWIEANCAVPDREQRGLPFRLTAEQERFLVLYYRLTDDGLRFFYGRGGQLRRPQKWGKGPLASTMICGEAVGPAKPDGFDARGEPVGRPWATPWIQVTACSEAQTKNVWRALQPMIELGALGSSYISDTGLTRINLPSGGLIEPVTASASSRLGNPITFAVQDQTESWVESNHGRELADNQRRNLGGTGGRFLEICNAPDPTKNSVAQTTPDEPGVYIDNVDGGEGDFADPIARRRVLRAVYGDSQTERGGWVDLDRLELEIEALIKRDAPQAERFYGNREVAGAGAVFDPKVVEARRRPKFMPPRGSIIVVGVDGAAYEDALALVATDVRTGFSWPLDIQERPEDAPEDYKHDFNRADGALVEAMETWVVWRVYIDDQYIDGLVERWRNRYGRERIVTWHTNRPRNMAWATREFVDAVTDGDWSHNGDPVLVKHFRQAVKAEVSVLDDKERPMHVPAKDHQDSPRKIDAVPANVIGWKARSDALELRIVTLDPDPVKPPEPKGPEPWRPGDAIPAVSEWPSQRRDELPLGFMM